MLCDLCASAFKFLAHIFRQLAISATVLGIFIASLLFFTLVILYVLDYTRKEKK